MTSPGWFTRSLEQEPRQSTVDVDGCSINVLAWGDVALPGLILIHGGAAHAHWWSFLAPMFSSRHHVVAFDLSGHGDSGRRPSYSHDMWAREAVAVGVHAGFDRPPVMVGHSLGGMVTIQAAATHGDELAGVIIVDSPVRRPDPETEEGRGGRAFRSPGVYATLDEALGHFHLIPPQPSDNQFIIDHIARHSLRETEDGWTWKFDHTLFRHTLVALREQLASIRCRVALLRGEHSVVVPPDTADYMYDLMGRNAPVVSLPEAHHHLLIDQPLSFVTAVRTLLADWEHSIPRR